MMCLCEEDVVLQSWGWTDLSSYSSLAPDSEQEQHLPLQTSIMSRHSLRLDDGILDRSLPHASTSFSTGGVSWRNTRPLKPRVLSTSCSDSLLVQTPHRPPPLLHNSVVSDASLLSSLLDESSIQETTLVDSFWGLDQDADSKENTVLEQRITVGNSTLMGSDEHCVRHPAHTSTLGLYCQDCHLRPRKKEPGYCSSSKCAVSSSSSPSESKTRPSEAEEDLELSSTIYSRERIRTRTTGKQVADAFRWLRKLWHHWTMNVPLTRSALTLGLLLLLLLLLIFGLVFSPSALHSLLSFNVTSVWSSSAEFPVTSSFTSSQSQTPGGAADESAEPPESTEVLMYVEPLRPPPTQTSSRDHEEPPSSAAVSSRLVHLEESVSVLMEQSEQRHRRVLKLHEDLHSLKSTEKMQTWVREKIQTWVRELLELQLEEFRTRLDQDQQTRQLDLQHQRSQMSHLEQLELDLLTLSHRMEALQQRQDAAVKAAQLPSSSPSSSSSPAVSSGLDRQSHDALLSEVTRLETALEKVRQEVKGVCGCGDGCPQLSNIQDVIWSQVSTRVQEEVRGLVYGKRLAAGDWAALAAGGGAVPQWLSSRCVSGAELQEALSSLRHSILRNVSLQLEQRPRPQEEEPMGGRASLQLERRPRSHEEGPTGGGVTQEEVRVMVQEALRLFSEDKTGLADFALESGGGSILSTRCSETYGTKAALLSLFGVPLWYFSQSPRAVIQPDVHPGNCWAFRGSTGFLVIRLSMRIRPSAFSLEHIPRTLAPSGTLLSAPRDFSVYGLDDETQNKGTKLGTFTYDQEGDALQTFSAMENECSFQIIEVQVLSNWGHEEYTCMYRFRVHGTPTQD